MMRLASIVGRCRTAIAVRLWADQRWSTVHNRYPPFCTPSCYWAAELQYAQICTFCGLGVPSAGDQDPAEDGGCPSNGLVLAWLVQ